jgi:predicted O-methyltransferase YrrM
MAAMPKDMRRKFAQTHAHKFHHHLIPNARVRPGNPGHVLVKQRSFSTHNTVMDECLNRYIVSHSSSTMGIVKSSLLPILRNAIENDWPTTAVKMISTGQAAYLQFLIQALEANAILEIGCFTGYSAVAMAEATVGHVLSCDIDAKAIAWTRQFLAEHSVTNVNVVEAKGLDLIDSLAQTQTSFDFIFVDGAKADYVHIYEQIMATKVLRPQGWLLFDNTLYRGRVLAQALGSGSSKEKMARKLNEFNSIVANDPRSRSVICPMYDGLTMVQKVEAS